MLTFFRTRTRSFLIVLLAVIGVSFLFLYNVPTLERMKRSELGKIDGQTITQDQYRLAYQASRLWQSMSEGPRSRGGSSEMLNRQSWNRLLLLASARKANLVVTDAEVTDFIKTKLVFLQRENQFDPALWEKFSGREGYLSSQGMSAERFIEIIREDLEIQKFQTSLTSPVRVDPAEIRDTFDKLFTPARFQVIQFDAKDYLSQVKTTDDEIQKEYTDNAQNLAYRVPERRSVVYAKFEFPGNYSKATDKEKEEIKRGLGEKALAFAGGLVGDDKKKADLESSAKAQNIPTAVTKPFGLRETVEGLPPSPTFNRSAFRLSPEEPVSEPVETAAGYYVLALKETQPGAPKPLAEVRSLVEANLRIRKASELANKAGAEASNQLKVTLALVKDFKAAAAALKLKVVDAPEFVPVESRSVDPVLQLLAPLTATLKPGQISEYMPGPSLGVIAYFKERGKVDEKKFTEMLPALQGQMENERKNQVLGAWFQQRTTSPGTKLPVELLKGQGVEGL